MVEEYEVCLAIQRALLDKVTPSMRQVSFILEKDLVTVYFFFDNQLSELEEELVGDAEAEIISHYPASYKINCELLNIKYPEKIHAPGRVVYSRYEE